MTVQLETADIDAAHLADALLNVNAIATNEEDLLAVSFNYAPASLSS